MAGINHTVRLTIAALALAAPVSVCADQPQTITISTAANPMFKDGKLQGCTIAFEVGRNDPEYSNGELVYITGSLNLTAFDYHSLYFMLKLVITGKGQSAPRAPAEAYLIDSYTTNKADFAERIAGEEGQTPGSAMFVFRPGETTIKAAVDDVIQGRTLTFSYAMEPGGLNAVVPVNLRIRQLDFDDPAKSQVDDQLAHDWTNCSLSLIDAAKKAQGK